MKKLFIAVALLAATFTAKADWEYQSFLKPSVVSLCVSNDLAANMGVGYTNLDSIAANGGIGRGTNMPGTMWTNASPFSTIATNYLGTQIIITNSGYFIFPQGSTNNGFFGNTNAVDYSKLNLLQDVTLWTDKPGSPMPWGPLSSGTTNFYSYGNLFVKLIGGSGANSTVTLRFIPLPDGTNQPTAATDYISITVLATTTTPCIVSTNLIGNRVIGAKKLRLVDIVNADADASSSVQILKIGFVGFRP